MRNLRNQRALLSTQNRSILVVGTARYAVRAAFSGAICVIGRCTAHVPPALRGRGRRSAASLPQVIFNFEFSHLPPTMNNSAEQD